MTATLNAPVYEVNPESEWYKSSLAKLQRQKEFFKKINSMYFDDNGFSYYNTKVFGIKGNSKDYEKYKEELLKNPDSRGIYLFKKRSKYYAIFNEMLMKVEDKNRFKSHEVFGINNITGRQWIGERWFFGVEKEEDVEGEEAVLVNYREYLEAVMDATKEF